MKIGEGTWKAMLSGGWSQAAEYFRLKEGEIYLFSFVPCERHVLEIMIVHIQWITDDPGMDSNSVKLGALME